MPVVIGGDNLPSPVGIGLTDLPNIGGAMAPLAPPVPASLGRRRRCPAVPSDLPKSGGRGHLVLPQLVIVISW